MKKHIFHGMFLLVLGSLPGVCQQSEPTPIYRVTVVERTTKAINYQYRALPTMIDFRGTVLMPKAKGSAQVESKQGRTEIDAKFENVTAPVRFGREYLTYVLWALTPDGRPHNIGEVIPGSSDNSHLRVTTDLQAFALIVTAEPYSAVRQPSDVVVLENQVRPDTVGKIEEVTARYELLPRGQYSWKIPTEQEALSASGPKVSMHKYEELLEIYQAQNAIGIARTAGAEQYAPNILAKAQQLLAEAQQLEHGKGNTSRVVQAAREASQTAEDARVIAERHKLEETVASAKAQVAEAKAEVQRAKNDAEAARAQAEAERAARERAEAEAAAAQQNAAQAQVPVPANQPVAAPSPQLHPQQDPQKSAVRMRLLEQLNAPLATRDTPRGLVATIPDAGFNGSALSASATDQVGRLGAIVAAHPGLRVEVEGHADSANAEVLSRQRAEAVRNVLVARGLPATAVTARGLGNSRPLTSSATEGGREENRRVEITISGDVIGDVPFWDRPYALQRR